MFQPVKDANFVRGEHEMLKFWQQNQVFQKLREKNKGARAGVFSTARLPPTIRWEFTTRGAVRTKDAYQRFFAMKGCEQRYQNGFDCQGLWVEVEVEKQLGLGTKKAVAEYGIDKFVNECKRRVLKFAARQTEQSIRLGYWMEWDRPDELRKLSVAVGTDDPVEYTLPDGTTVTDVAHRIVEKLGNPEWGGSYFTFPTTTKRSGRS